MEKMRMHKKMAMSGKAPSMKKYKSGGMAKKISGMAKKIKKTISERAKDPRGNKALDSIMKGQMRDMNKTGRGAQAREATFIDKKTKRLVLDTPSNRKRYGSSRIKKVK